MSDNNAPEEKSAVELEREKINSTGFTKNDDDTVTEVVQEGKANPDPNVEPAETTEEAEEQIEASEKTEDELEQEKKEAKTKREKDRIQKRIDKEVAKRKELEATVAELTRKLEDKGESGLSEEDVETRADRKAAERVAQKEFEQACNRLADGGEKLDADFLKKVGVMGDPVSGVGPIPSHMIGILDDLDNGPEILSYLANDFADAGEEAEELYKMSPARMAVKLAKLSNKIKEDELEKKKKATKGVSKVPDPLKPLPASGKTSTVLTDNMDMDAWVRTRNKQIAERSGRR